VWVGSKKPWHAGAVQECIVEKERLCGQVSTLKRLRMCRGSTITMNAPYFCDSHTHFFINPKKKKSVNEQISPPSLVNLLLDERVHTPRVDPCRARPSAPV